MSDQSEPESSSVIYSYPKRTYNEIVADLYQGSKQKSKETLAISFEPV